MPSPFIECPVRPSESPCVIAGSQVITFRDMDRLIETWSRKLQAGRVTHQDRVAMRLAPSPQAIALLFAIWRLGASACPLNLRVPQEQIPAQLQRLGATCFVDDEIHPLNHPKTDLFCRSLCLFTSGSTAEPKIAVLSLASLLANAAHSVPIDAQSRYLLSLPLFHVSGIGIVLRSILHGAAIVLDAENPAITHVSWTPTHLYRGVPSYPNLACALVGGAPIASYPESLPIYLTYGLTEMGSMVASCKTPPRMNSRFFLGHPLPGREIRIDDTGEILVRGNTLFQGYLQGNTLTCPLDSEGWFATGDLGQFDPEQGLAIIGRKDWQFISGGENIQPEEIELALKTHPGVLEASVVAKEHPEFGHVPVAVVSARGCTQQSLQDHLRTLLPSYKIPKTIVFTDELPKKGLKIDRQKVCEFVNKKI